MQFEETEEVQIGAVHYVEGAGFGRDVKVKWP